MASKKYRISIKHSFGPFRDMKTVSAAKKALKTKVPKIKFTSPVKSGSGYRFSGQLVYIRSVDASASVVKSAVQKMAHGASVTVTTA
jgi:hypothetical protein